MFFIIGLIVIFLSCIGSSADNDIFKYDTNDRWIKQLLLAINYNQHPPKSECHSRRLLVTQFPPKQFEGIGSCLKAVALGLAEAIHSNRTLIWGLDNPYIFEHSKSLWRHEPGDVIK